MAESASAAVFMADLVAASSTIPPLSGPHHHHHQHHSPHPHQQQQAHHAHQVQQHPAHAQHNMQHMIATFFFVAYVFLIVVAVCGSTSVVFLVLRYRNLRSRPINFYYANMAAADLFLASLGAPFRALYYLNMRWTLGAFICHWFEYAENLAYFVHVYSLTVASFLVLQDVCFLRRNFFRRRRADDNDDDDDWRPHTTCLRSYVVSSFGVWTFGILACLPYATYRRYEAEQCPRAGDHFFFLPERLFGPLALVVLPVAATVVAILFVICCACSATRSNRVVSTYQENLLLRTQKSIRHISLLMLIYIFCQIPHFALKWLQFDGVSGSAAIARHDTLLICAAGLRLATVCFSAAFFCYISEEKVLYNVRHAVGARAAAGGVAERKSRSSTPNVDKIPLRGAGSDGHFADDDLRHSTDRYNYPSGNTGGSLGRAKVSAPGQAGHHRHKSSTNGSGAEPRDRLWPYSSSSTPQLNQPPPAGAHPSAVPDSTTPLRSLSPMQQQYIQRRHPETYV